MSRRSAYTQELSTTQKCSSNVTCSHHDITHYSFDIKQQTLTRSLFIQFSISNIYISTTQTYHRGCNQINTTGATSGEGTAYISGTPEFTPVFSGVRQCYSIFIFMSMFCRSLFVLLSFSFWPLRCLSFFDLRILITPLVSTRIYIQWDILLYKSLVSTNSFYVHL